MEMRRLVTGKQMKEIDGYAIRKVGIPSLVLMERAALAVADEMEKRYGKLSGQRLLVFCGTGNNGADGAALARILFLRGALPTVLTVGDKAHWTGEMTCQVAIDRNLGIPVEAFENYVPGHVGSWWMRSLAWVFPEKSAVNLPRRSVLCGSRSQRR